MTAAACARRDPTEVLYHRLMSGSAGAGNAAAFAGMIASRCHGGGALAPWLGLEPAAFRCLLDHLFPGSGSLPLPGMAGSPRSEGDPRYAERADERDELVRLMLMHRAGEDPSEVWMAHVVADGCMAADHLWQDLGLPARGELTALMRRNFPTLAARNLMDMKWKRFLYKQLCEAEGIYTCRAPSCQVCTDYHACFGPED
jgi:nitrogen fixation protein NifQ